MNIGGNWINKNVVQTVYRYDSGRPLPFLKKALDIVTSKMSEEEFYKAIGEKNYRMWLNA